MKYHVIDKLDSSKQLEDALEKMEENKGKLAHITVTENCTFVLIYTTE